MEIGSKIKEARVKTTYTQEQVAEEIGVSRQTISNWENNKSYPDIVSIIRLSDLYSISLDELLKGDEKMMKHLDKTTNDIRSRQKFAKIMQIMIYLIFWAICFVWYWIGDKNDYSFAPAFGLLTFYAILPIVSFVIALIIGKDDSWGKYRWIMIFFFGIMYGLMIYGTVSMESYISHFSFFNTLPGIVSSGLGMAIGLVARIVNNYREKYGV